MNKFAAKLKEIPRLAVLMLLAAMAVAECIYVLFVVLQHLKPW